MILARRTLPVKSGGDPQPPALSLSCRQSARVMGPASATCLGVSPPRTPSTRRTADLPRTRPAGLPRRAQYPSRAFVLFVDDASPMLPRRATRNRESTPINANSPPTRAGLRPFSPMLPRRAQYPSRGFVLFVDDTSPMPPRRALAGHTPHPQPSASPSPHAERGNEGVRSARAHPPLSPTGHGNRPGLSPFRVDSRHSRLQPRGPARRFARGPLTPYNATNVNIGGAT